MDPAFFFRYPGACDAESPEGNHPDGRIHESIVFHSEAEPDLPDAGPEARISEREEW